MATEAIEREEWLLALGILADMRASSRSSSSCSEAATMKRKKQTPEEIEAWRQYRREAAERLRRARELVAKGLAEIEEKRAQERRETS